MKLCLIDASGYIYRAYHAEKASMKRSDGTPVNAIYGYCKMLAEIIRSADATHMAVVLDAGRSGREELDPNYKGNRPPKPDDLIVQLRMLEECTASHSISAVKIDGMEADDVIATLAQEAVRMGGEATIYSSDKDLMQLLVHDGISIYDPWKRQHVTPTVCADRFGVTPDQVVDYLALVGDASDNVPGVPGVGPKGAASLLQVHGDLDTVLHLAATDPIYLSCTAKQRANLATYRDQAILSRDLVRLKTVEGCPDIDLLEWSPPDMTRLRAYLREMEFAILERDLEMMAA